MVGGGGGWEGVRNIALSSGSQSNHQLECTGSRYVSSTVYGKVLSLVRTGERD